MTKTDLTINSLIDVGRDRFHLVGNDGAAAVRAAESFATDEAQSRRRTVGRAKRGEPNRALGRHVRSFDMLQRTDEVADHATTHEAAQIRLQPV